MRAVARRGSAGGMTEHEHPAAGERPSDDRDATGGGAADRSGGSGDYSGTSAEDMGGGAGITGGGEAGGAGEGVDVHPEDDA